MGIDDPMIQPLEPWPDPPEWGTSRRESPPSVRTCPECPAGPIEEPVREKPLDLPEYLARSRRGRDAERRGFRLERLEFLEKIYEKAFDPTKE